MLDHDSNVAPWLLLARDTGATVRMAELDPSTGRLAAGSVIDLIGPATRWGKGSTSTPTTPIGEFAIGAQGG